MHVYSWHFRFLRTEHTNGKAENCGDDESFVVEKIVDIYTFKISESTYDLHNECVPLYIHILG